VRQPLTRESRLKGCCGAVQLVYTAKATVCDRRVTEVPYREFLFPDPTDLHWWGLFFYAKILRI
jgi:hypothetical protein